ncbi:MAG: PfkB family carbohydrate kinase [Thermodesulfobacteriota bacterium]
MQRTSDKIFALEALAAELDRIRPGRTVVHCHGVFDLLHIGHIRYLEEARSLGDVLVVTLTEDRYVNKGPHRPAFTQALRAEALAALDCVDYVAVNQWPTAVETIALIRPNVYVKGGEYRDAANDPTGKILDEARAVEQAGGRIHFTDGIVFSSSNLINTYYSPFPPEVAQYLRGFAARHPQDRVLDMVERAASLRVLCLGESIIDEHHYCETLGKSGKEPILAARFVEAERAAGGILAIASHLAGFTPQVDMATFLGEQDSHEEFIRDRLRPEVRPHFLYLPGSPTIVKRRFVETYPLQKLFEVYVMNGCEESAENGARLRETLSPLLPGVDLVIVADYGHGMFDEATIAWLTEQAPFLALNTQVNAGNLGFNTVYKYPRADFVSVSEKELRMAAHSRVRSLCSIVEEVASRLGCPRMLITRGKQGCLAWGREEGFFEVPAFTGHIVDRVGAGDAVLSISSLLARLGAPMEVVGVLANVAGAQAVGTMSNRSALDKTAMVKHFISLLK